jgi:hypothetical protein
LYYRYTAQRASVKQSQPTRPVFPPHLKGTVELVKKAWKSLLRTNDRYLDEDALTTLSVSVSPLHFTTGQPQDGSDQFIHLDLKEIELALWKYKPWNREGVHMTMSILDSSCNMWQARFIWFYFKNLLQGNEDDGQPGIFDWLHGPMRV